MMNMRTGKGWEAGPRVATCPMNFVGQANGCQIDNEQGQDQETEFDVIPLVLAVEKGLATTLLFTCFSQNICKGFCLKMF